jgi:hypothetical protein
MQFSCDAKHRCQVMLPVNNHSGSLARCKGCALLHGFRLCTYDIKVENTAIEGIFLGQQPKFLKVDAILPISICFEFQLRVAKLEFSCSHLGRESFVFKFIC